MLIVLSVAAAAALVVVALPQLGIPTLARPANGGVRGQRGSCWWLEGTPRKRNVYR